VKTSAKGYTLIEIMMALVVLAIGATGIYSLQAVAVHANEHARDTTEATTVARFWMEQLRRDSLNWAGNLPCPASLGTTQYLSVAGCAQITGAWFTPAMPTDWGGAAQQPMGRELEVLPAGDPQGRYCAHVRLSPLRVNRLIRAEVRVWWRRAGSDRTLWPDCGAGSEIAMETDTTNLHWLYLASTMEPPS
jgi:type IV pilus assembly protein PilV